MKTQTLQHEYTHVYSGDPAIDRKVEGWQEKYSKAIELSELDKIPLVPGQKPAIFRLRHLSRGERNKVGDLHATDGLLTAMSAALQLGLVDVQGIQVDGGAQLEVQRTGQVGRFVGASEATLDAIAATFGGEGVIGELANRILATFNPRKG